MSASSKQKMFFFEALYSIDLLKMKMMRNFFFKQEDITYHAIINKLYTCGRINIDDKGGVGITLNSFNINEKGQNKF